MNEFELSDYAIPWRMQSNVLDKGYRVSDYITGITWLDYSMCVDAINYNPNEGMVTALIFVPDFFMDDWNDIIVRVHHDALDRLSLKVLYMFHRLTRREVVDRRPLNGDIELAIDVLSHMGAGTLFGRSIFASDVNACINHKRKPIVCDARWHSSRSYRYNNGITFTLKFYVNMPDLSGRVTPVDTWKVEL